jgi:hypothetical protein
MWCDKLGHGEYIAWLVEEVDLLPLLRLVVEALYDKLWPRNDSYIL